jgi:hypothetical protein
VPWGSLSSAGLGFPQRVDDPDFYHHVGVDSRIRGAGYTTITQGIVKLLFFDEFELGLLFVNAVYLDHRDEHDSNTTSPSVGRSSSSDLRTICATLCLKMPGAQADKRRFYAHCNGDLVESDVLDACCGPRRRR